MTSSSHRFCTAPMMDWTDRHCRFFLRQISRHARLYTEMVTAPALMHGDVPRHLDFDPAGASGRPAARRQRSCDARACGEARRAAGATTRSTSTAAVPSERVQTGSFGACLMAEPALVARLRARDARRGVAAGHRQASHRPRCERGLRLRARLRGNGGAGGMRRVHRPRAQRGAEGLVAEGESRGAAAALRRRAPAEARLPAL